MLQSDFTCQFTNSAIYLARLAWPHPEGRYQMTESNQHDERMERPLKASERLRETFLLKGRRLRVRGTYTRDYCRAETMRSL